MKYEQNIPFYTHTFEQFPWKKYETDHYIFHVEKDSLAEREIDFIKKRQEDAYAKIITRLELDQPREKIQYYFYPSREKKKELMGDDWYGQSIYNEFRIHVVYNETDKVLGEHEDTHLLTLPLGLPISFFQEGLAEMMVGKSMFGNSQEDVVKEGLEKGIKLDLVQLMSQQGWLDTPDEEAEFYYSAAGLFIANLYKSIGLETFKKLYSQMSRTNTKEENIVTFESITGQKPSFFLEKLN